MQTFLPFDNFDECARVLDRQRLGKQRVETLQIMQSLADPTHGWRHHPAVKMWRGHALTLLAYQHAICNEWARRGYKDTCRDKTVAIVVGNSELSRQPWLPAWLGNPELHRSHRSNLVRKLPDHYVPLFETELPADLDYVWPV